MLLCTNKIRRSFEYFKDVASGPMMLLPAHFRLCDVEMNLLALFRYRKNNKLNQCLTLDQHLRKLYVCYREHNLNVHQIVVAVTIIALIMITC